MNLQETAIKYGVPLPETCIELEWEIPTKYIWVETDNGYSLHCKSDYLISYLLENSLFHKSAMIEFKEAEKEMPKTVPNRNSNSRLEQGKLSAFTEILTLLGEDTSSIYDQDDYNEIKGIPAPQMHEILSILKSLIKVTEVIDIDFRQDYICYYDMEVADSQICVNITNNHIAQAMAEFFLELKEAKVI